MKAFCIVLLAATLTRAAINDPCTAGSTPGICLTTTSCSSSGGTSHVGFCPKDPTNVQCCTKSCGSGGICRFTSSCTSGNTVTGIYSIPYIQRRCHDMLICNCQAFVRDLIISSAVCPLLPAAVPQQSTPPRSPSSKSSRVLWPVLPPTQWVSLLLDTVTSAKPKIAQKFPSLFR